MAKYRKKPVVIEAEQFDGTREHAHELSVKYASNVWPDTGERGEYLGRLVIDTLEGRMYANKGDWIITGIKGERYPVKPDIFEATYEPVEEN